MTANLESNRLSLPNQGDAADVSLLIQLRELAVYKWQIVGLAVLATLVAVLVVFSMEPTYRSTATVLIEPKQENVLNVDEIYDPGAGSREYYATQYEILRSRELAARAISRIDWVKYDALVMPPESEQEQSQNWKKWLPLSEETWKDVESWVSLLPFSARRQTTMARSLSTKKTIIASDF